MGIVKDVEYIKSRLNEEEQKKKEKKFKLPFFNKIRGGKANKNYVTVMRINENGFVSFKKELISEQTIMVDGVPRLACPQYVLHYERNPILILPSWSVKPYSPSEENKKSLEDGSNTKGYAILMARMESEVVGKKKKIGNLIKWVIGIGLLGIIGYAIFTGGI